MQDPVFGFSRGFGGFFLRGMMGGLRGLGSWFFEGVEGFGVLGTVDGGFPGWKHFENEMEGLVSSANPGAFQ